MLGMLVDRTSFDQTDDFGVDGAEVPARVERARPEIAEEKQPIGGSRDGSEELEMDLMAEDSVATDADLSNLPVLYPEDDVAADAGDAAVDDEPVEEEDAEEEELAVSEWPQPVG